MEGLHSCVDSPMPCQLLIPRKSLSTRGVRTSEGPLPCVDPLVVFEASVPPEGLRAVLTKEWFVAIMDTHVLVHADAGLQLDATDMTDDGSLSSR